MSGLGLIPNEIVGWRIKPDWYNFTVVVVKRFGTSSKRAGQEYEESLAYCRSIESATQWLVQHVTRVEGEKLQDVVQEASGSVASAQALFDAIVKAQAVALAAVAELEVRLTAAGLNSPKLVTKFLGEQPSDSESAPD